MECRAKCLFVMEDSKIPSLLGKNHHIIQKGGRAGRRYGLAGRQDLCLGGGNLGRSFLLGRRVASLLSHQIFAVAEQAVGEHVYLVWRVRCLDGESLLALLPIGN